MNAQRAVDLCDESGAISAFGILNSVSSTPERRSLLSWPASPDFLGQVSL